jgi:hypothetical protein
MPWMIHVDWSYAHRVAEDGRVFCTGYRVADVSDLRLATDERKCNDCASAKGISAL